MPDWKRYVREHLPPLALNGERELEVVEELAQHLESIYEEELARGASKRAAFERAITQVSDWRLLECEVSRAEHLVGDAWLGRIIEPQVQSEKRKRGGIEMGSVLQDVRYALRMMVKNLGFTGVAVLTLALGICGVTTQFSVVDAALLRGLPFPEPDRLVRVAMRDPSWAPERDRLPWMSDVLEFAPKQQSFEGLAKEYPQTNRSYTKARLEPLLFGFVGRPTRQLLLAMLGAVAAVLLIACTNVMNMQFSRATARSRELAIRGALGASRGRLVRQMLTESLVLAVLGGVAGALLARWAIRLFAGVMSTLPTQALPSWMRFEIDGRVLGFTVAATALSVLLSGLLPALLASHPNLMDALKESARGHTSRFIRRLTSSLVVGQIALTSALLICSLLLIRSLASGWRLAPRREKSCAWYSCRAGGSSFSVWLLESGLPLRWRSSVGPPWRASSTK